MKKQKKNSLEIKMMKECRPVKIKKLKSLTVIFRTKDKINETLQLETFAHLPNEKKNLS